MISDILQWIGLNSSWVVPILYIIITVLITSAVYYSTYNLILASAIEGILAVVFIVLVYMPFRYELHLEPYTLFTFILITILCLTTPLWYMPRIK